MESPNVPVEFSQSVFNIVSGGHAQIEKSAQLFPEERIRPYIACTAKNGFFTLNDIIS